MTEDHRNPKNEASPASEAVAKQQNRRRLLKAAALAAPLLITLRGKPAHGVAADGQASLGSLGILYGPGAYVTQQDFDNNQKTLKNLKASDVGRPIKIGPGGTKKILIDPTRRNQNDTVPGRDY